MAIALSCTHALLTQLSIIANVMKMLLIWICCIFAVILPWTLHRERKGEHCLQKSQSQSQLRSSPMPKSVDSRVLRVPAKASSAADSDADADADALRMRSMCVRQHSDRGRDRCCHDRAGVVVIVVGSVDVAQRRRIVSILKIRRDSEAYLL